MDHQDSDFRERIRTSFANQGAMVVNLIILVIAVLVLLYANAMTRRGVLR